MTLFLVAFASALVALIAGIFIGLSCSEDPYDKAEQRQLWHSLKLRHEGEGTR